MLAELLPLALVEFIALGFGVAPRILGIPVVALCDTNCDPSGVDYVIPGNDDALKAIRLFTSAISDAVISASRPASDQAAAAGVVVPDEGAAPVEVIHRN